MSRRWLIMACCAAAVTAGLVAAAAARYYPAYRSALAAQEDLRAAQALLEERRLDASEEDLAQAEARLQDAERGFRRAAGLLDDPLIGAAGRLPFVGSPVRAATRLTEMGIAGTEVGHESIAVARTYRSVRDEGAGSLGERSKELLERVEPQMSAIGADLAAIRQDREALEGVPMPSPFVSAVEELDGDIEELDGLVQTYHDLSSFLPEFLGFDRPRTYLVLAQNNAELMPTGGLISVYGLVTFRDGRVEQQEFEDAVSFGGRWLERTGAYIEPPAPLKHHLLRDYSWNFAVSNWSPDFPTAAREAQRFFSLAGGRPVDGVIAINVRTIETLLQVTGPITVDEYGVTVSPENALDTIEEHTRSASEPETDRKAFVGVLAEKLLSRLSDTPPERWTALIDAVQTLRDERELLLFDNAAQRQPAAERLELSGAVEAADGDYLMLVDASLNSTKLNVAVDQQVELRVELDTFGAARHELRVHYHNDLPAWERSRDPELVRRLMLGGLYGGYVRLLAPEASRLEALLVDGRPAGPEEAGVEAGKASFGKFFALPKGRRKQLTFRYTTADVARKDGDEAEYRLHLQKQSGTDGTPVRLSIELPQGARPVAAELDGVEVDSLTAIETDLSRDRQLIVRFELE